MKKKVFKLYDIGVPVHWYCVIRVRATSYREAIKLINSNNAIEEYQVPCKPGARKKVLMDIHPIKKD